MAIDWRHPARNLPDQLRGPYVSSGFHALVTVLGIIPYPVFLPIGPVLIYGYFGPEN